MSDNDINLFARAIHGIEWIAAAELEKRFDADVTSIRHREIRFATSSLDRRLLTAGSVDDIFAICKIIRQIDHSRASLSMLASAKIDGSRAITLLRNIRELPKRPSFNAIGSFLGRRNYNRYQIEDAVAEAVKAQTGWIYNSQRDTPSATSDISFRIHLSGDEAIIGVRLSASPLHRRPYKLDSRTGTLHPPMAFAMALLSSLGDQQVVLDPFCGVGTIPIESLRVGSRIDCWGLDIDSEIIHKAALNSQAAKADVKLVLGDAAQMPFAAGTIERIISNPPWGRVVGPQGKLRAGMLPFFREISRVLHPQGRTVLLVDSAGDQLESIQRCGLRVLLTLPVSLFGSWVDICLITHASNQVFPLFELSSSFGPQLMKYWEQWPSIREKISSATVR